MIPFAGWEMPVQYGGILDEHLQVRSRAGLFDTSHMGEFLISGATAAADMERLFTGRLDNLAPGRCRYGFLLNPGGGFVDDVMVYRRAEQEFLMVVNAGTTLKDRAWVTQNLSDAADFHDISADTAMLALQGPAAAAAIESLAAGIETLRRFAFIEAQIAGVAVTVSRTGYTGEDGYEIFAPAEEAGSIWDLLLGAPDVLPVGLGARDTLRLEKGYPLYGSDIDQEHNPTEARLTRFVRMEKDFIGRQALIDHGEAVDVLTGFVCDGRRSPRAHFKVIHEDRVVGTVTSGAFSPSLKLGIGLCYIDSALADDGRELMIANDRAEIPARVQSPPFV